MTTQYQETLENVRLTHVDEKRFALELGERIFYIGAVLYDIIILLKDGKNIKDVRNMLLSKHNVTLTEDEAEKLIEENLQKVFSAEPKQEHQQYIYGQVKILNEKRLDSITKRLTWLYYKPLFVVMMLLGTYMTFSLLKYMLMNGFFNTRISLKDGAFLVIMSYVFMVIIGIIHELGHATATMRYKIKSKEIGFGFYLIFPVFYTDVTRVWLLNRKRRLVVNMGGIYFQFIINMLFFIGFFMIPSIKEIVSSLFITNTILALYALNPLMRNDGYWMYSDFWDLPNLTPNAHNYLFTVIEFFQKKRLTIFPDGITSWQQKIPFLGYVLLYWAFMVLLPIGIIKLTTYNFTQLTELWEKWNVLHGADFYDNLFRIARLIFFYIIMVVFMTRIVKSLLFKMKTVF
jgi:putative peptide zinc metalloprotease protein